MLKLYVKKYLVLVFVDADQFPSEMCLFVWFITVIYLGLAPNRQTFLKKTIIIEEKKLN